MSMTFVPLRISTIEAGDLQVLRASILRSLAGVVRSVGVEEHELGCSLDGEMHDLHVVLTGPPMLAGLRQAIGVRVLDAVHADGRTFGSVDVEVRAAADDD